jgi:hypothetical protein
VAECARKPALAEAACPCHEQITPLGDTAKRRWCFSRLVEAEMKNRSEVHCGDGPDADEALNTNRRPINGATLCPSPDSAYPVAMGANQDASRRAGVAASTEVEAFIARWQGREGGQERANYAMFLTELCSAFAIQPPDPAGDPESNDYVFERVGKETNRDGTISSPRSALRECALVRCFFSSAGSAGGTTDFTKGDQR